MPSTRKDGSHSWSALRGRSRMVQKSSRNAIMLLTSPGRVCLVRSELRGVGGAVSAGSNHGLRGAHELLVRGKDVGSNELGAVREELGGAAEAWSAPHEEERRACRHGPRTSRR